MAGRRWRLARRLSLLLLPRVVLAAAASASLSLVVLLLPPGGASVSPFSLAWLAERRLGSVAACASLPGAVGQRGLPVGRDAGMVMAAGGN